MVVRVEKRPKHKLSAGYGKRDWDCVFTSSENTKMHIAQELPNGQVKFISMTETEFIAMMNAGVQVIKRNAALKERMKHKKKLTL